MDGIHSKVVLTMGEQISPSKNQIIVKPSKRKTVVVDVLVPEKLYNCKTDYDPLVDRNHYQRVLVHR